MQSSAGLYFKSQYYSLFPLKELVIHYSFLFNSTLQRLSLFCLRLVLSHIFLASRIIKNYWSRKIKHNRIDSVHMQKLHHTEESASPTSSVKKWSLKRSFAEDTKTMQTLTPPTFKRPSKTDVLWSIRGTRC